MANNKNINNVYTFSYAFGDKGIADIYSFLCYSTDNIDTDNLIVLCDTSNYKEQYIIKTIDNTADSKISKWFFPLSNNPVNDPNKLQSHPSNTTLNNIYKTYNNSESSKNLVKNIYNEHFDIVFEKSGSSNLSDLHKSSSTETLSSLLSRIKNIKVDKSKFKEDKAFGRAISYAYNSYNSYIPNY